MSEARVMKAQAEAYEIEGASKAKVREMQAEAEAKAIKIEGESEAEVIKQKSLAEAEGINKKAEAMKEFDSVGKEHEEFKLKLNKDKEVELAQINIEAEIAKAQAEIIKHGLTNANVDIVGGDSVFFDKLVKSITRGKQVDRFVNNSELISEVKNGFLNGDLDSFKRQLKTLLKTLNIDSETIKNLTISSAIMKYMAESNTAPGSFLKKILEKAQELGIENDPIDTIIG